MSFLRKCRRESAFDVTFSQGTGRVSFKRLKKHIKKQRSCVRMLLVTFLVFSFCSIPYNLFYVSAVTAVKIFNDYRNVDVLMSLNLWMSLLVIANSMANTFIYAGMHPGFRKYLKLIVRREELDSPPRVRMLARKKKYLPAVIFS